MFKLEEICEELSQIQIPMRADELESIGVHVEEEASTDEVERFQDGYIRDIHSCLAERSERGRSILSASAPKLVGSPAEPKLLILILPCFCFWRLPLVADADQQRLDCILRAFGLGRNLYL